MINVPLDMERIRDFCQRWHVTSFALFGSVLREDFRPDSDIDVLVAIDPEAHISLFGLGSMLNELEDIFGRKVDLIERCTIETSRNPVRKQEILSTAQEVYRAAA